MTSIAYNSGGAEAIKNDIPEFGFCLCFGGGTGGIANSAVGICNSMVSSAI